jgi:hypothetical protein
MTAVVASPAASGAPSPALLVEWIEVRRFLRAIGRFDSNRIVLALFPESTTSPCIHIVCSGDALAERTVRRDLMRPREPGQRLALGMVINAAAPVAADWGTKPEHFGGKDDAEKVQRCLDWNHPSGSMVPGARRPRVWGASNAHLPRGGRVRRVRWRPGF